ncbi:C-type Lectin CRL-like [Sceloporus undulatus]|uniref:C-type Lectin CRL-like n=1 Tax=Sceloporus undulatus TaxID=8520 RepID=UPI001C4ACA58|nr:C-type Lectin CRL-like [Sceloporus undulatus]
MKGKWGLVSSFHLLLWGLLATSYFMYGSGAFTCPDGWFSLADKCYGLFKKKLKWDEAEVACQALKKNSHLASIMTEPEGNLIGRFLLDKDIQPEGVWIGLADRNDTGEFRWTDKSAVSYMNWGPGSSLEYLKGSACAFLNSGYDYAQWLDAVCDLKMYYLCMRDAS